LVKFLSIERSAPPLLESEIAGGDSQSCDKGLNLLIIIVYRGPVLRHPAELLAAVGLGGRVWLGGRSCKGWPAAPAFGG